MISQDSTLLDRIVLRCDLREDHRCRRHRVVEGMEPPDDYDPWLDHLAYCTPAASLPDVVDARLHLTAPSAPFNQLPALPNEPATKLEIFAVASGDGQRRPRCPRARPVGECGSERTAEAVR